MKFNVGEWVLKPGVTVHNCEQIRQVRVAQNQKSVYLYGVSYREDRRGLDGPSLELTITAPQKDILRLQAYHFRGGCAKMPDFQLNDAKLAMDITQTEDSLTIKSGKLALLITFRPCSFTYFYQEKRITAVGERFGSPMISTIQTPEGPFMRGQIDVGVGEKVYGMGERFTSMIKNGQVVDIWNEDGGTSSEISYKNIPFYLTNRGYGVLVNDSGPVSFEVCTEATTRVQFSVPGEKLDYLLIGGGNMKSVLRNYTNLTGRPALPPPETFGLWLSSSFTTSYDEKTVLSFVDGMKERGIPMTVFHFDCFWMKEDEWCGFEWDEDMFPDIDGLLKNLHDRGLKVCVWINPYIGQKSKTFDEALEHNFLLRRENGDVWQWDRWQAGCSIYDFTNPECREWYKGKLKKLMRQGVDYFKTDFGERIPTDVKYFDGSDPLRMHNYYTLIYNRLVFEAIHEERGMGEACVFARSATVGGQCFPVHWGGDCNSTYPSMAESLRGGLSLCLSGFGFWSHDMGGFEGTAPDHVYKRWLAFGLLSSHSRLHGSNSYRVPWLFGDEAVDVCREFAQLKAKLMPYLYSLAVEAHHEGVPMMRAMPVEFPHDITAEDCDRQYMLGDALLVAPIMREDNIGEYYLPRGTWTHLLDGRCVNESGWHSEEYDFHSLPLFVRENKLLPLGKCSDKAVYDYASDVTMRLYALKDCAQRTVYDAHGQEAFGVQAKLCGDEIHFTITGKAPGLKLRLMGIQAIEGLKGAKQSAEDGDVVLTDCKAEISLNVL